MANPILQAFVDNETVRSSLYALGLSPEAASAAMGVAVRTSEIIVDSETNTFVLPSPFAKALKACSRYTFASAVCGADASTIRATWETGAMPTEAITHANAIVTSIHADPAYVAGNYPELSPTRVALALIAGLYNVPAISDELDTIPELVDSVIF